MCNVWGKASKKHREPLIVCMCLISALLLVEKHKTWRETRVQHIWLIFTRSTSRAIAFNICIHEAKDYPVRAVGAAHGKIKFSRCNMGIQVKPAGLCGRFIQNFSAIYQVQR